MAWLLSQGPLSPYRRAFLDRSPPQLVLVLGGDVDRERMGARLARQLDLPLLVSGGSNREYAEWMLDEERLDPDRVPWRWARWWPAAAEFSSPAFPWPAARTAPRRDASSNGVIGFVRWRG